MGHRSWIVRHRPTTLPGATSRTRAHRHLGRADKKTRGSCRSPRSPVTHVILEGRRPGGSIGAAFRSIILLLLSHDGWIVGLFRSTLISDGFGESRVREGPTAGSINRSRLTTLTVVFGARLGKSINEFAESSVRGRLVRVVGIPDEHRAYESTSEFEARSRVLEGPGGSSINSCSTSSTPVVANVEQRSSGSINELSSTAGLPSEPSIRFVKSIRRSRVNRLVNLKNRSSIIYRLFFAFHRLSILQIHVGHVLIFPESVKEFFEPAILGTIRSFSLSRGSSIHTAVLSRATAMMSGRETSFR